ncbi:NAD-dependent epimerase/dehydratase family protein [Methanocella arvoryzae]|uniref:UDP-glucose 4-epimerase n=1 Tax=Methanocella arvoryzae (strain DSM 22066 / NBRC 105507 / MRE50) TaxID=351160 RepID=Q0W7F9_METAR|nr:NAD-dependent epimerase/dehydratase family protein [Methanocella arvoryzae]CAJ35684.1 putative UDP-glucose 4-epimerase [Methanocella arvoryzae MRE50]
MSWSGKRVLVTGAKGFIGRYLVDALLNEGAEVTALSTDGAGPEKEGLRWAGGDITKPVSIEGLCKEVDIVYHLAAISNVDASIRNPIRTFETNAMGTANVLEEARKAGVKKFVYVSSAHVYGVPQYLPIDEKHPVVPREAYAASKIAAENIVQAYGNSYGIEYAILRPFNIFGPGQDPSFLIPGVIKQALENGVIKVGNTEPTRDFLYIEDAVRVMLLAGEKGTGIFNIGSGQQTKILDIVQRIRDEIDPAIPIVSDQDRMRAGKIEIPYMYANVLRIEAIGWHNSISLDDGLSKTIISTKSATFK